MTVTIAKDNLEQYFTHFTKTNTGSIKKPKSLLEQLKTWAMNQRMKKKQAKSFKDSHAAPIVLFLEDVWFTDHEKLVAFNVFIAICKIGAISFNNNQLVHN